MEMTYQNKLLKVTAILMIVFAVLSVIATVLMGANLREIFLGDSGVLGPLMRAEFQARMGPGEMADFNRMFYDPDFETGMQWVFGWMGGIVVFFGILGAAPRFIAGIMGLRRCANPGKHQFFLVWGIVLLVLGVFGLSGAWSSFLHPLMIPGAVVCVGNVVLPILYIVGVNRQKKVYIRGLQSARTPGINYDALPSGSHPKAPPAPEAQKPEPKGPEF